MNEFNVEVLEDGRIKVTSPEGFSPELHLKAEEFLAMLEGLAGGSVETKTLKPNLGSLTSKPHQHGKGHHHH